MKSLSRSIQYLLELLHELTVLIVELLERMEPSRGVGDTLGRDLRYLKFYILHICLGLSMLIVRVLLD